MGDIQTILQVYENSLGQMINTKKTTLFFSKSVTEEVKNSIKAKLEVPEIKQYEMYLGLPAMVGKNRSASLNYIKDRIWGKLQIWKEKLLSQVGKEVLLKAWSKQFPLLLWDVLNFPWADLKILVGTTW